MSNISGGKLENATDYPKTADGLEKLFSEMIARGDKPLSKITVQNYKRKLIKLHTLVTGTPYNGNLEWINNPKNVIAIVNKSILTGKKDYMTPVIRLLKYANSSNDTIAEYQKGLASFKSDEDSIRKDNKASAKEQSLALPLKDIQNKILEFKPENDAELVQKVIASFYFLNPSFTPRNDLYEMKIVSNTKKANKMDPSYNYIVINKEGKSEAILMNNYKTKHTYGRQRFSISPELKSVLDEYLLTYGKQAGDFLFVMKDGKQFSESNFRNLIESSMEYITGKPINIGLIRKIKITDWYSGKLHSINDTEAFHHTLLHSSKVGTEYIKTDLFDKIDD